MCHFRADNSDRWSSGGFFFKKEEASSSDRHRHHDLANRGEKYGGARWLTSGPHSEPGVTDGIPLHWKALHEQLTFWLWNNIITFPHWSATVLCIPSTSHKANTLQKVSTRALNVLHVGVRHCFLRYYRSCHINLLRVSFFLSQTLDAQTCAAVFCECCWDSWPSLCRLWLKKKETISPHCLPVLWATPCSHDENSRDSSPCVTAPGGHPVQTVLRNGSSFGLSDWTSFKSFLETH